MRLNNLISLPDGRNIDILIQEGKIVSVSNHTDILADNSEEQVIKFDNAIVFPGLINSHDHLDFNSFPQLGNRTYKNYIEWGLDIHLQNKDVINKVLKISKELRIQWGIYKNLLNGITTVINHGPALALEGDLITIEQNSHVLHSVANEKKWRFKLNMPFLKKQPFVIHIGEGTDEYSKKEIDTLLKWNLFNRDLIGIHAVTMNEQQASKFKAIVWCPDSNTFLLGKTAEVNKFKDNTTILFGTDSTVSANWNLWDQLRVARSTKLVTDEDLFNMLTTSPVKVWNLPISGTIAKNYSADVVIARKKSGPNGLGAFFALNPEDIMLVIHKGVIRLFDEEISKQLFGKGVDPEQFSKIFIMDKCKYIFGNLPELIRSIRGYYPEANFPVAF